MSAPVSGATTVNLKGGLGSASAHTRDGLTVGALVAVNAAGCVTVGDRPQFWAAPFERGKRVRRPRPARRFARPMRWRCAAEGQRRDENTTLAVIATDAKLIEGAVPSGWR